MDNIKVYMDNKEYEILKGTKVIDFLKENSTEEKLILSSSNIIII